MALGQGLRVQVRTSQANYFSVPGAREPQNIISGLPVLPAQRKYTDPGNYNSGFSQEDMKPFPHVLKWIDRIAQRPAVKRGIGEKYQQK